MQFCLSESVLPSNFNSRSIETFNVIFQERYVKTCCSPHWIRAFSISVLQRLHTTVGITPPPPFLCTCALVYACVRMRGRQRPTLSLRNGLSSPWSSPSRVSWLESKPKSSGLFAVIVNMLVQRTLYGMRSLPTPDPSCI